MSTQLKACHIKSCSSFPRADYFIWSCLPELWWWQRKKKIAKNVPSSGVFPESISLSPVAISAVFSFPSILTAKLGDAVLLYGSLVPSDHGVQMAQNSAVSKAHSGSSRTEPKPHHQAICYCCSYSLGDRNIALILRRGERLEWPEKETQTWKAAELIDTKT